MMKVQYVAGFLLLCSTGAVMAATEELGLRCEGEAVYTETETTSTYGEVRKGKKGKEKENADFDTYTEKQRTARGIVRFVLGNYSAKIKLPSVMLPLFSNEDDSGWLNVEKLKVSDKEIRGTIDLGTFSSADLSIDRRAGDIEITGVNSRYSGTCAKDSTPEKGNKF